MLKFSWKKIVIAMVLAAFAGVGFVFVSRFYVDKGEDADSLSIQVPTNSGKEKVFSRSEMRAMIEGFGEPSEEDIQVFQKDPRYADFLESLKKFDTKVSKETLNSLLRDIYLMWFRQEHLNIEYEFGRIDMDGFSLGLNILVKMRDDSAKEKLTDEQYFIFMGEEKSNIHIHIPDVSESTYGYSDILAIFPAIRNGEHPEIRSSADLYGVISKESIEKIKSGSKKMLRFQRESTRAFRLGKISQEEYDKQLDAATQAMRDAIKSAVTPEQEMFLFGYEF